MVYQYTELQLNSLLSLQAKDFLVSQTFQWWGLIFLYKETLRYIEWNSHNCTSNIIENKIREYCNPVNLWCNVEFRAVVILYCYERFFKILHVYSCIDFAVSFIDNFDYHCTLTSDIQMYKCKYTKYFW